MKICMFTNTYLPHVGGVARSVSIFAEDLQRMGHAVRVVAPTYPDATESEVGGEVPVFRVPAIQNFNGSDFSVRIPIPFIIDEQIDRFNPDLIHSHHPFLLGDAAIRASQSRGLPLVFTHHTLYEQYTHYVSADSEVMRRFAIRLSTEYANLCSHVIAPSESVAELLRKRGVHQPVTEIPTGVDVDFFGTGSGDRFRSDHGIAPDATVIGHLGRLAPEKNLDYLTDAVVDPLRNRPDLRFLVVGDGPSRAEMARRFADEGLTDQVILAGKLTGRSLSDAYHAMDLFVFSSCSETQGMVLTEAMAAGNPVIALDAPGAREVVEDDRNGRLLTTDAPPEDFSKAVADALDAPDTRRRWSEAARRTAEAFSRSACAKKLSDLYESLARSRLHYESPAGSRRHSRADLDLGAWDEMLRRMEAEWDLLSQKASAVAGLARSESGDEAQLD